MHSLTTTQNAPMWRFSLFVSELIQQASLFQTVSRNATKRSVFGVSCDFCIYFWLYTVCSAISAGAYLMLGTIHSQYALRYPEYPDIYTSKSIFAVHACGSVVATAFLVQMFYSYRLTRGYDETTSLLCNCVLVGYGGCFLWVVNAYLRLRSTVNALDVADCLWLIGASSRALMFVLQISVNWFFLHVAVMHRNFRVWQLASLLLAVASLAQVSYLGIRWYEVPTNAPLVAAIAANSCCVAIIWVQSRLYRSKKGYSTV